MFHNFITYFILLYLKKTSCNWMQVTEQYILIHPMKDL